jgi:hypothetical protein
MILELGPDGLHVGHLTEFSTEIPSIGIVLNRGDRYSLIFWFPDFFILFGFLFILNLYLLFFVILLLYLNMMILSPQSETLSS